MSVLYWLVLSYGRVTKSIVYTEQGENHGTVILRRVSYSAYTLWYGSYCRYGTAPSSQSSFDLFTVCLHLTFYGLLSDVCLEWYLRPMVSPPTLCY